MWRQRLWSGTKVRSVALGSVKCLVWPARVACKVKARLTCSWAQTPALVSCLKATYDTATQTSAACLLSAMILLCLGSDRQGMLAATSCAISAPKMWDQHMAAETG